jgi:hypothetical protein
MSIVLKNELNHKETRKRNFCVEKRLAIKGRMPIGEIQNDAPQRRVLLFGYKQASKKPEMFRLCSLILQNDMKYFIRILTKI